MANIRMKDIVYPGLDNTYTFADEAEEYSSTDTYKAGEYRIYDGKLYKCKQDIDTAEVWTAEHWEETKLGNEVTAQSEAIEKVNNVIFPNENVLVKTTTGTLSAANSYWLLTSSTLIKGRSYRIRLKFSDIPTRLANIRTSTSQSGAGNVDTITSNFIGDSWTEGKECIYIPPVDGIKYLQIQFNSAYTGGLTFELKTYDYTKENETVIVDLQKAIDDNAQDIEKIKDIVILTDAYNLLPPDGYTVGKLIAVDGSIANSLSNVLSDYIEIDETQEYICNWAKTASIVSNADGTTVDDLTGNLDPILRYRFCFFDADKNVIPFTGDTNTPSKAIPQGAKYIRVTINSEQLYPYARLIYGNYETQPVVRIVDHQTRPRKTYEMPNTGMENFKMVMFGDSITHGSLSVSDVGTSYVNYANDYLHSNIINVGFGGTRMTYTLTGAGLFCFYNLCDCIVSEDADAWDALDAYATGDHADYLPHLNTLKSIDWSTVNAIGLMYGANDYTSNTPVGTEYNETVTNYDGACAYGLKKLLTKYPHLQVMILAPFDREMTAGDASTMTDRQTNTAGLLMKDYADSLEHVASHFHCPLIKTGELFGINQYNILLYASDGTHPRSNIAQKRLGWLFAQAVKNNLAPFNG